MGHALQLQGREQPPALQARAQQGQRVTAQGQTGGRVVPDNRLTFRRLLGVMDGYKNTERGRRPDAEKTFSYNTIFVAGMHFQDAYNYDTERARRCVIHQSAPDGKMYPFCTYNSGPYYRERVEEKMQTTKISDYRETGDPHASADRKKHFPADPSLPKIEMKDYGCGANRARSFSIPENYGCCSTAKG